MSSKQRILDEAYLLFAEYGEHFSLSQVTKKLGIKKQSIYNYFVKKDDLIVEMLTTRINQYYEEINQSLETIATCTPKEQLYQMGLFFINSNADITRIKVRHCLSMIQHTELLRPLRDNIEQQTMKHEHRFIDILKKGIENEEIIDGDLKFFCCFYFTFLRGLIDGAIMSTPYESSKVFYDKFFEEYWSMISTK